MVSREGAGSSEPGGDELCWQRGRRPGQTNAPSLLLWKAPGGALREASQRPGSDTCRRRSSQQPKPRNNCDVRQLANRWTEHSLSAAWMPSCQRGTPPRSAAGRTLKHRAKRKEAHTSDHMRHGFIYTRCSKRANYRQKIGGPLSGALGWNRGVHCERGGGTLRGQGTCWTLTCGNSHATQHVTKDAWDAGVRRVNPRIHKMYLNRAG